MPTLFKPRHHSATPLTDKTDVESSASVRSALPSTSSSNSPSRAKVDAYYRSTIDDYQAWSLEGYMHFGLWRAGLNPFHRRAMLEAMNDLVFDALDLGQRKNAVVGDFGCGVGAVSQYGSLKYPSHHWKAFTLCPEQVAFGNRKWNNRRTQIAIGDFHHLPLVDEGLDAAFFLESICHSDQLAVALCEAYRVLKPGGKLVIVDGLMKNVPMRTSRLARWLARTVSQNWAVPEFHAVAKLETAIRNAGFEIDQRQDLSWQIAPCVAHSVHLVLGHSLKLLLTGKLTVWKRRHLIGCALGVLLGMQRHQFGYYLYVLRK